MVIYLLSEVLSRFIGGFLPTSVVGMLLLFGGLQTKIIKEDDVAGVCNFILSNMMLFFVPVTVGIMVTWAVVADNWANVILTMVISTIMVMVVVGFVQQKIGEKWKK